MSPRVLSVACRPNRKTPLITCADTSTAIWCPQVYRRIGRPRTADELLAPRDRPLAPKLEAFLEVLVAVMQSEWGGKDRTMCTQRMVAAAQRMVAAPAMSG